MGSYDPVRDALRGPSPGSSILQPPQGQAALATPPHPSPSMAIVDLVNPSTMDYFPRDSPTFARQSPRLAHSSPQALITTNATDESRSEPAHTPGATPSVDAAPAPLTASVPSPHHVAISESNFSTAPSSDTNSPMAIELPALVSPLAAREPRSASSSAVKLEATDEAGSIRKLRSSRGTSLDPINSRL